MSRLSGIVATYEGEELFSTTWKNYLNIDGLIWKYGNENKVWTKVIDHANDLDAGFYTDFAGLEKLYSLLKETLTEEWFKENDLMSRNAAEAYEAWSEYVLPNIEKFLKAPWAIKDKISVYIFSCF